MPILSALLQRALSLGDRLEQRREKVVSSHEQQRRTLRRLLRKASSTAFGQYYDFRDILQAPDLEHAFRQHVPVHTYDRMHDRWWHMTLNEVENVTWRGRVRHFALSSGTSGAPSKKIPVTDDMMRAMRRTSLRMFFNLPRWRIDPLLYTKDMFMLGGTTDLQSHGGYFLGDLSGINASKLPFWFRPFYKPGGGISRINNWDERINEIARRAPEWDVSVMVGIPAWLQLALEKIIAVNQLQHIHQIWPNLTVCVHGGVHFEPYRRGFEKLMGKPLVYMDSYLASEGFIAYQSRPATRAMKLVLNNGIYFEFVPFREENFDAEGQILDNPQVLSISEVQEGVDYALLISTCAGAWRYIIGDTVRFTDCERAEIVITGRTKHFLSICGEHLSVENMNDGIRQIEEEFGVDVREFTVAAVEAGNFFAHRWYIGIDRPVQEEPLREALDRQLCEVNDDYRTERRSVLQQPQLRVIPTAIFYEWQEAKGKMGGQNKFPRVMKREQFAEWEAFVETSLSN